MKVVLSQLKIIKLKLRCNLVYANGIEYQDCGNIIHEYFIINPQSSLCKAIKNSLMCVPEATLRHIDLKRLCYKISV